MNARLVARSLFAVLTAVALTVTGCSFEGLNSVPLPGAVGRGPDATTYHVDIANVGTLESNSPVMIDDVVVGSVGSITVKDWHAVVDVSVKPDVAVPANAVAKVGQTSLLGSMHLALDPPVGQAPEGRLQPGATLGLNRSSTYPSTERTLSSLAAVVNGGGLGQIGDVIHNFSTALNGREAEVRDVLTKLNDIVALLDDQRGDIVTSIDEVNRFAGTLAGERDSLDTVLRKVPPALDVLIRERPRITTALNELGKLSATGTRLIDDSQADLVHNLQNLEPAVKSLADIGPDLDAALAFVTTFPYSQGVVDRAVRGDYLNLQIIIDLTIPRLRRTMFLGTRWGQPGATLTPAPGDPFYLNYTYAPLAVGINPPPPVEPDGTPPESVPMPPVNGPVLPVTPPQPWSVSASAPGPADQIFAGPYPNESVGPPTGSNSPGGP